MYKGGKDQSLWNSTDMLYHARNGIEPSSNATWTIITSCIPGLFFLVLRDEERPAHVTSNYLLNHNVGLCANRSDTNQRNKGKITQVCQPQWQLVNSKSPSLTCMCGYWHKMHPTATTSVLVVLKIYNAFKVHLILQSNIKLSNGSQNSKYQGNSQVSFS